MPMERHKVTQRAVGSAGGDETLNTVMGRR